MISLASLWLPIVLAAVAVFLVSALVWMVLPWHRRDFAGVPDEEETRRALAGTPPGQYLVPYTPDRAEMQEPEFQRKYEEGPVAFVTVVPSRAPNMAKQLSQWFVFSLLVSGLVAYIAGRTHPAGAAVTDVLCVTGLSAWLAYGLASVQEAIWFGRPWSFVVKQLADALLYALATAAVFAWLWPAVA